MEGNPIQGLYSWGYRIWGIFRECIGDLNRKYIGMLPPNNEEANNRNMENMKTGLRGLGYQGLGG